MRIQRTPFTVWIREQHEKTLEGLSLLHKAADKGHLESIHFLYEMYFRNSWQVWRAPEKAKAYLDKYLSMTDNPLEREILDNFDYYSKRIDKVAKDALFCTRSRVTLNAMPPGHIFSSKDESYYDDLRDD